MNVVYSWLLEFFSDPVTPETATTENRLTRKLTELVLGEGHEALPEAELGVARIAKLTQLLDGLGLSVERTFQTSPAPQGVVVAEVTSLRPVEGSDHLLLAEVWDGTASAKVVTGAPNTALKLRTALAKPGTTLSAVGLEVSARELAGVTSEGVLCSPRELGVYDYGGGLIVLGDDAPVGAELRELWPAETVIELELTPNRADAFSLLGVARDLAAKLGIAYTHPAAGLPLGDPKVDDGLEIRLDDPGCSRFVLQRVDNLSVKPSPLWVQRRLAASGLRPRNNLVDVTNYVTFELGQPSHAYDVADLSGGTIVVRRAEAGESLTALNDEVLTFTEGDLLITTPLTPPSGGGGTQPIGVAGVIGGLHHSVKPSTVSVALEVAHFDPVSVRKTAKRLGLSTDAHTRFERGVDPNLPPLAAARAAQLMAELGGGTLHAGLSEVGSDAALQTVAFRPARVAFLTALEVPLEVQRGFLEGLGCRVSADTSAGASVAGEHLWQVTVPSWRFDLATEADLVEEVARLYGYEHIPQTVPVMDFVPTGADTTQRGLRTLLAGMGFQETLTYSFTGDAELGRAAAPAAHVRLASPPSLERSVLRTALYPGLLAAAQLNRGERIALFEIGRVFLDEELERVALLLRGPWAQGGWASTGLQSDFYVFKGLLEKLAATLGARFRLESAPARHATLHAGGLHSGALHPGVSAVVYWNDREVGFLGQLHPEVAARYELGMVFLAELELPLLGETLHFSEFSRQPFAERDLAVIAPATVSYAALGALVLAAAGDRLETVSPFDVYAGPPIPAGQRSVALRLQFRDPERALEGDEVDGFMATIVAALTREGYGIRDR